MECTNEMYQLSIFLVNSLVLSILMISVLVLKHAFDDNPDGAKLLKQIALILIPGINIIILVRAIILYIIVNKRESKD